MLFRSQRAFVSGPAAPEVQALEPFTERSRRGHPALPVILSQTSGQLATSPMAVTAPQDSQPCQPFAGNLTRRMHRSPALVLQTSNPITLKPGLPFIAGLPAETKQATKSCHVCLGLQSQFHELQSPGNTYDRFYGHAPGKPEKQTQNCNPCLCALCYPCLCAMPPQSEPRWGRESSTTNSHE